MVERLLIVGALVLAGLVIYCVFTRCQLARLSSKASQDPVLKGLRQGTPAVIYFSTPDCIPCITQQKPALARLEAEVGQDAVQIIHINAAEDPSAAERWGVMTSPTTFILDATGKPGAVNYGVADVVTLKRQLQKLQPAS